LTFSLSERVGYVLVAQGWSNAFTFTVPTSAVTGAVRMRVRISYAGAQGGAPIDPCAVAMYGETEDYRVNITQASGIEENTLMLVNIYPNPVENELIIDLSAVSEYISNATLLDITGKEVKSLSKFGTSITKFDMSDLAAGTYQVVIKGSNSTVTRRIVKH